MQKISSIAKTNILNILKEAETKKQLVTNIRKKPLSFFGPIMKREKLEQHGRLVKMAIKKDDVRRVWTASCHGIEICQHTLLENAICGET